MISLVAIASLTLTTAALAMAARNLVHSALLLVASWAGIAAFYLWAAAEFVAFAQVLIYVGAVSMIVLFAVVLTRPEAPQMPIEPAVARRLLGGLLTGGALLGLIGGAIVGTEFPPAAASNPALNVRSLGTQLMGSHLAAVLIVGVILTVALLGALVIASPERNRPEDAR